MATEVYDKRDITLQDGTEVTLRPSVLQRLRRVLDNWEKFGEVKNDNEGFDVFINCCGIALEPFFKDKYDVKPDPEEKAAGKVIGEKYREHLEDTLDLETIYVILDVCAGIKLKMDPKLLAELQSQTPEEDGQTST